MKLREAVIKALDTKGEQTIWTDGQGYFFIDTPENVERKKQRDPAEVKIVAHVQSNNSIEVEYISDNWAGMDFLKAS